MLHYGMNKNATLKNRIMALVLRASAHHNSLGKGMVDFNAWEKENAVLEAELTAINKDLKGWNYLQRPRRAANAATK
jgi:hypothetical protein